ncbi:MAG: hypothetical protein RLO81_10185 [Fulvivirga sp.]|uniref:hypothetical protein n=1 Tax=Fulvivirga sp. TaxID=1931237 RepID=UPI0032EBC0B6
MSEPFRACNEGTRRKVVYPDDLMKYAKIWDKKLTLPFKRIPRVDQPLKKLLSQEKWDLIFSIASGDRKMDSLLNLYFDQSNKMVG